MASFAVSEMPWPEVGRALARDPRLIVPVGALEQHGPHLPVGTNLRIAERIAEAVSNRTRILRAPVFSYGVTAGRGPFAGTAGLRRKTFHRAINELLARWEDDGVSEFVFITTHRFEPHLEALLMALTDSAVNTIYDVYQINVSDLLEADPETEHGGELETSLLLHLEPGLVRMDEVRDFVAEAEALRRYIPGRVPKPSPGSRGVVGRPSLATADKGRAVFDRWVDAVCADLGGSIPPAAPNPSEPTG